MFWIRAVTYWAGTLAFGEEFAESGSQEKHHFTSYESEGETGNDYAVNRQYTASVGRFGSADPYQASSYLVNPQSWNRYSNVENDPIHNVDPLGLIASYPEIDPCGCAEWEACGGEESTPIAPPSIPVEKHYRFPMKCKKNAVAMMVELKKSFAMLASWQSKNLFISFERRPIRLLARLAITSGIFLGPSRRFHVNVIRSWPTGWTFGTESDHVFYPGTIKFSAEDVPGIENVMFSIDLVGVLSGISARIGFLIGFDSFEDDTWNRLAEQIKTKICK